MSSSKDFEKLAEDWLTYTERETEIKKQLSELTKAKRAIGDQLKEYMKTNSMDDFATERGTIIFCKSVSKPSTCNKKTLKDNLDSLDWKKLDNSEQVTEQIFAKMPAKESEGLKREKQKAKKEDKPEKTKSTAMKKKI
jgi:hypothetical protein